MHVNRGEDKKEKKRLLVSNQKYVSNMRRLWMNRPPRQFVQHYRSHRLSQLRVIQIACRDISYVGIYIARANNFLFINYILYLLKYQIFFKSI
jgi:hypothetical protein